MTVRDAEPTPSRRAGVPGDRITRLVVGVFLAVSTLSAGVLLFLAGRETLPWLPLAAATIGMALVAWMVRRRLAGTASEDRVVGLILLLTVVNGFVVLPESLLRSVGFRYEAGIDFAPGPEAFQRYIPDPALFWRWDDRFRLNSLGYPEAEPQTPKSPTTFRILYLGDSCTWSSYPAVVEGLLAPVLGAQGRTIETINLAVPGYSSHQGRVLAERFGEELRPDLVVVAFGWNDHWPAFGAIDSAKVIRVDHSWGGRALSGLYQRSRSFQGLAWIVGRTQRPAAPLQQVRVPIRHFTANLVQMGERFTKLGTPVLFMTLPTAHERFGVPPALSAVFHLDSTAMIDLHKTYAEGVREVTEAHGWPLLDLHRSLADHPTMRRLFSADGIHYTETGKAVLGSLVAQFIEHNLVGQAAVP